VRAGRRSWVIGDPDAPRSWSYLPDVAATLVTLGTDQRAWGRAWHVPSSPPRTQREALGDLAGAMGRTPGPVSAVPWPALRAVGPVVPLAAELVAVRHQWDGEFVLDWSETTGTFGLTATPWSDVMAASVGGAPGCPRLTPSPDALA
jgi:nucleoside-diphosphate-sugar epimerase